MKRKRSGVWMIFSMVFFWGCKQNPKVDMAKLDDLYHQCDTVILKNDTLWVINSKYDTTIVETGIFSLLQYDYPLTTPSQLVKLCKLAIREKEKGNASKSYEYCREIAEYLESDRPKDLKTFSDMNLLLQYEVNSSIIYSYAYNELGETRKSMDVLSPFLANIEATQSGIHKRFIDQCIKEFGVDSVKKELERSSHTIKKSSSNSPEYDKWVVTIFGAEVGVKHDTGDSVNFTVEQADSALREMEIYRTLMNK